MFFNFFGLLYSGVTFWLRSENHIFPMLECHRIDLWAVWVPETRLIDKLREISHFLSHVWWGSIFFLVKNCLKAEVCSYRLKKWYFSKWLNGASYCRFWSFLRLKSSPVPILTPRRSIFDRKDPPGARFVNFSRFCTHVGFLPSWVLIFETTKWCFILPFLAIFSFKIVTSATFEL